MTPRTLAHDAYRVGWICPLEVEQIAAMEMLDEEHNPLPQPSGDTNIYNLGSINTHNVVIAGLHKAGNCPAATVATHMSRTFLHLDYILLVGIGGGVPVMTDQGPLRLGHVVVSQPTGIHSGAVQYDHGKAKAGRFERTGSLALPPIALLNAAREVAVRRQRMDTDPVWENTLRIRTDRPLLRRFRFPGTANDYLYQPDCDHRQADVTCKEAACDIQQRIERPACEYGESYIVVHRGTIASGELVVKDAQKRDKLAREHDILCFETEAVGALANLPCLVIRGISDYCDTHKNDAWHGYAAAVAAAYARQLFFHMPIEETIDEARRHPASLLRGSEYITSQNVYDNFRLESALRDVPVANNYVDRPHDMEELENVLLPTNDGSLRRRLFVLYGLGGIGKTQLASVYIRRHQERYSSILWLDGRSEDAVRRSLAAYARFIPAGQIPEGCMTSPMTNEDANSAIENVLGWLAIAQNTGWILIFDNVDQDYDGRHETGAFDIQKYIPGEHGAVLITTRLSQLGRQVGGVFKELRKADKYLAQSIFEEWLGRKLKEEGEEPAFDLLTLLDGLPLALAQAGSFLHETGVDIPTYVCFYKEQWDDLMRSDQSGLLHDHGQRSIATTWEISLREIQARNTNAANLVRLWGFADKNDISHDIIQAASVEEDDWPSWLHDLARNKLKFLQAIQLLLRYSMIQHTQAAEGCYSMHPVVQRWTVYMQVESERNTFLRLALILIGKLVPSSSSRDYWLLQQRLLPHADRCAWGLGETRDPKEIIESVTAADSIHWLGILYADQGRREEAEAMYSRALEGVEKALGTDHKSTLETVNNLGSLYAKQGRQEEAEAIFKRALEGKEKALGTDHTLTLDTVNNLGGLYAEQGRLEEAEVMFERALEGFEKALGTDHTLTLNTTYNLGTLYVEQGRLEEAEVMFERALEGFEKALGPDHTSTLNTVNNLGGLYTEQGRREEAEVMFKRALEGYKKALRPDHTSTLNTINNLGGLYTKQGRREEAEAMYSRALEGKEKALGPDHISTLNTINSLGSLYAEQGRREEAEVMFKRALEGKEKALGPDHTSTLNTINSLGSLYAEQGRREEAKAMFERGRKAT